MATTNLHPGRGAVSRTLSTRLAAPNDLDAFSRGLLEVYMPRTQPDYWTYRRYMHDILCLALLEKGLFRSETLMLSTLGLSSNDKKLNLQKPDLYSLELTSIEVGEVLLSYNFEPEMRRKQIKYKELFDYIHESTGMTINYNVFGVDLTDPEWEDHIPKIPQLHLTMLRNFISNLRYIHSNSDFSSYRTTTEEYYALDKFRFELSEQTAADISSLASSNESLEQIRLRTSHNNLSWDDMQAYVSDLADGLLESKPAERPAPKPEPHVPQKFLDQWEKYKLSPRNTDSLPRVLQLGSPAEFNELNMSFEDVVHTIKSTRCHGGYLDLLKSSLSSAEPSEGHIVHLSLSDDQLMKEQLQGPGRKSALKKYGLKVERKAPKHIGIDPHHITSVENLIQQLEDSTTRVLHTSLPEPPLETTGISMSDVMSKIVDVHNSSPMSGVAKFYQNAAQEIVINSMRRRKNRQYVLCQSGMQGVFILIAPGAQLRTESNVEFVKIISLVRGLVNELSAPWHPVGDHWESDWLSVDTDRLKQWSRSYDRTLISNVACAERLVEEGQSLYTCCVNEIKRGNYQLMVLMYIEDKQLTSLTNQTIRYLWIKALGDKQLGNIISKFPTRVGSVIQSLMMQRSVAATLEICSSHLSSFIKLGSSMRDEYTGSYDETTTGVSGKLPRLFTTGPMVPLAYNLNEIYWCMMYNKDRQNPTQDSLGIMSKILREEQKFETEMSARETPNQKMCYLFGNTTVKQDLEHCRSQKPEAHFYSRPAVLSGMLLQSKHEDNMAPDNGWRTHSRLNDILSKNISEFATFKASVKSIASRVDTQDLKEIDKIGKRTKAVELVAEIVTNEKLSQAFEVVMTFSGENNSQFEVLIQIFKKGQIGGIREIMILFIKARILFNVVEEICRLMAKSDKREILTKGKDKRLMMRGDYEEVLSMFPKGTPVQMVKNSYDMTTWCQKFIPTIFTCIYENSFADFPHIQNLANFIFLKHTMKKIEYPKKLIEAWMKHPEIKHEESWLQSAKEKFLLDGIPYLQNKSNMCQGIPHYNSTILALSCQSLRDELFRTCLKKLGQECRIRWKTRVGSDDKGDMIGVDMSYPESWSQYLLFEQCAHFAERLHSMELSVKSAAGNVIYELNSAYMANLETLSPTIKFALASCDMIATTSCSVFVNESYGRIRQMRENGASSVLCGLAHMVNSKHFYKMFRTDAGMTNDVASIFGVPKKHIPYDFGVYPFYDVDLQEIVGPEYHNYVCLTGSECPEEVKSLLFTPLSKDDLAEAFPGDQESLLKKDHFGIQQGLVRQLVSMRKRVGVVAKDVEEFFSKNPFLMIRGPETVEETLKAIQAKLLTKGASEALRRTSPAIYLGRLSAFESAKAWVMRKPTGTQIVDLSMGVTSEIEDDIKATYSEFLKWGLARARAVPFPVDELITVIFPQKSSFDVIKQFVGQFGLRRETAKKHSQAVRTWVTNSYNYNFTNSLKSILETSFGMSQMSSKEDVNEFRKLLGFNLDTYEGFIEECNTKGIRPMDLFFFMSKIYKSSKESKVQTFANGPSTHSLHGTLISIKKYSHLPNNEMVLDLGMDPSETLKENRPDITIEGLRFCANLLLMESQELLTGEETITSGCRISDETLLDWCRTRIRTVRSITGFDHHTRKILLFVASQCLPKDEFKEKLVSWKTLNFSYIQRQKKVIRNKVETWEGNLSVLVNSGNNTYTLHVKYDKHYIECRRIDDPDTLLQGLQELCRMLSLDVRSFFVKTHIKPEDLYLSANRKSLISSTRFGTEEVVLRMNKNKSYPYLRLRDFDIFEVVTNRDMRTGAVSVHLSQRNKQSATLCHFPGSYYPVSVPLGFECNRDFWFRGVRLTRLLENTDWFHNYRLPALTDSDCASFFVDDVDFETVMKLDSNDRSRVVDYLQVNDELAEDLFSMAGPQQGYATGTYNQVYDFDEIADGTINEMFERAMLEVANEGAFTFQPLSELIEQDWAEEMTEEDEARMAGLEEGLENDEDNIKFVRSMGYTRPKRRANYQVISQLQHGYMLKDRILNMFFRAGSVTAEERRVLPHQFIWIRDNKSRMPEGLAESLQTLILTELQIVMGASKQELLSTLSTAPSQLGNAPRRLQNFVFGVSTDLFTQLSEQVMFNQTRYEEESTLSE
jgi:hypothetical protein